jgi:hypothetical protein
MVANGSNYTNHVLQFYIKSLFSFPTLLLLSKPKWDKTLNSFNIAMRVNIFATFISLSILAVNKREFDDYSG